MNNENMYDQFSQYYDRFMNWEARLAYEMPFLGQEINAIPTKVDQPIKVLDTACGTGQHAIAFSKLGYEVSAADFSTEMVAATRKNAELARSDLVVKKAGFGDLSNSFSEVQFDVVLCLGNSLPHVLNEDGLAQTLNDFREIIKPGGKLIIQNRNFDKIMSKNDRWMSPQTYKDEEYTNIFIRFYDFDANGLLTFNLIVLVSEDGENFQQQVISTRLWPMKKDILVDYLQDSGFTEIRLFGDLSGAEYETEESENLVITAIST
jgi:ubiquinone/menaquinone biosynthesis C-methylase UbiE